MRNLTCSQVFCFKERPLFGKDFYSLNTLSKIQGISNNSKKAIVNTATNPTKTNSLKWSTTRHVFTTITITAPTKVVAKTTRSASTT
jgi:hypothetical protein